MTLRNLVCRAIPTLAISATLAFGSASVTTAHGGTQHPVTINLGTCAALGEVAVPLGDAGDHAPVDGVPAAGEKQGSESAVPVDGSLTNVSIPFADLLASPHAIVIHASADETDSMIACGDIGGHLIGPSIFPVGLAQVEESGTWGVAILQDNGDGTTEVGIYVVKNESGDHDEHDDDHDDHGEAAPEATPGS